MQAGLINHDDSSSPAGVFRSELVRLGVSLTEAMTAVALMESETLKTKRTFVNGCHLLLHVLADLTVQRKSMTVWFAVLLLNSPLLIVAMS